MIFDIIKQSLNGRETEDDLIEISIETTRKIMLKFVEWCDDNCCYINHDTGLWESRLLGIQNYTTFQLYFLFDCQD